MHFEKVTVYQMIIYKNIFKRYIKEGNHVYRNQFLIRYKFYDKKSFCVVNELSTFYFMWK